MIKKTDDIKWEAFCEGIKTNEGFYKGSRSYRNNSPGNFRFTQYIKLLGASGKDKDNYAVFPDYQTGWQALKKFVLAASKDQLARYHNCDIQSFADVYAPSNDKNDPKKYAEALAKKVELPITAKLKDFI